MELRNLVDTAARLAEVRDQLDQDGPSTAGSTGQIRAHPLLVEESRLRAEQGERLAGRQHLCYLARSVGY